MMNCAYHPEVDAIGACVNCGRLICAECKVVLGEKIYCNPCADKLFAEASTPVKAKELNWFQRHLNWTVILTVVALYPLDFVIGLLLYSIDPYMAEETVEGIAVLIAVIVNLAVLFLVGAWALKRKARNLWHLLWLIVPFGLIIFLCLENKSGVMVKIE